jgi:hypothetical protein
MRAKRVGDAQLSMRPFFEDGLRAQTRDRYGRIDLDS